jgi:VWFA-related protein
VARFLESFKGPAAAAAAERQRRATAADAAALFASPETLDPSPPVESELGFEDYVRARLGLPFSELDCLFYGLKYLQFMPGEKHLVFVAERGPELTGAWDQVQRLTRAATSARVALDTIQLGQPIIDTMPKGTPRPEPAPPLVRRYGGDEQPPPRPDRPSTETVPAFRSVENAVFDVGMKGPLAGLTGLYDLRYVAAQTGGLSSTFKDAGPALARIDATSRTHYLLAYYPTNGDWNGRYRSVRVEVNRPGAVVLFRHGYYASRTPETFDRRGVVSSNRIESAGYQLRDLRDIDVQIKPAFTKDPAGRGGELVVELSVDISGLSWTVDADGLHVAEIDVAIYASDRGGDNLTIVGQTRRALNLRLTDATYEQVSRERFTRVIRVPVSGRPRFVKAIVYDYDADRVGSVMKPVK